jgi:hypothetical protein
MAGLVPAIHALLFFTYSKDVDARHKPGMTKCSVSLCGQMRFTETGVSHGSMKSNPLPLALVMT